MLASKILEGAQKYRRIGRSEYGRVGRYGADLIALGVRSFTARIQ